MPGLTVVTGPPCAGKSRHVDEHRQSGDVVIDLDRIAQALGYCGEHVDWSHDGPHRILARDARAHLVRTLMHELKASINDEPLPYTVWLVDTAPRSWQRVEYRRVGATIVDLDPGREVCHERAKAAGRSLATHGEIERWYAEQATR